MTRLASYGFVLSPGFKFYFQVTFASLALALLALLVAYVMGSRPIMDFIVFVLVAVISFMVIGSVWLIRQSKRSLTRATQ